MLADQAQAAQRLEDLDAVAADAGVHDALVDGVGETDRALAVAATYGDERVDHAEVGVHAPAGDQEDVARAVVGVEVVAVVEVLVAGECLGHGQRGLVDGVLVEVDGLHGGLPGTVVAARGWLASMVDDDGAARAGFDACQSRPVPELTICR